MCKLYSCIVTKAAKVYGPPATHPFLASHTEIAAAHKLKEDGKAELLRAKVEILPPESNYSTDPDKTPWHVVVDEEKTPDWWTDCHDRNAYAALTRWWNKYVAPLLAQGSVIYANGAQHWYRDGKLHREGGPAEICADGTQCWYRDGKLHREDGPALIRADGMQYWYRDGKLHREGGPALIRAYGMQRWYRDGKLHREDGPAVIRADGMQCWYRDGKLHREDGPAEICADGTQYWYRDGKLRSQGV